MVFFSGIISIKRTLFYHEEFWPLYPALIGMTDFSNDYYNEFIYHDGIV